MKNFTLLFISILIFSSCEKFDDSIPDGGLLETPTLIANLVGPDKVSLIWSSGSICAGECPSFVPATYYEIWTKSLTSTTNYKLAETPAGETAFLVEGLEPGVTQEFFVIAKRANFSNKTNRVMVVPNELPTPNTIFEREGFDYITHPQLSPDGETIAYSVSDAGSTVTPQQVFLYDLAKKSQKLISENGKYPAWSASGESVLFVLGDATSSTVNGYSIASGELNAYVNDSFQSYFPVYGAGDSTMLYFIDSLDQGESGVVAFQFLKDTLSMIREESLLESSPLQVLGMNFLPEENTLAYSIPFPKETELGYAYDIVGFDQDTPSSIKNLVVSEWNDSNPCYSIQEPTLLAFVSDRSGSAQLWVKELVSGKLYQVTDFKDSQRIINGIAGLSWNEERLFINIQDTQGVTRFLRIDVSSLIVN